MYYKVRLYKHNNANQVNKNNRLKYEEYVCNIIVKKGLFFASEIISNEPFYIAQVHEAIYSNGFYIRKSDLVYSNLVSLDDVIKYQEKFDLDAFNEKLQSCFEYKKQDQKSIKKYLKKQKKGEIYGKNKS